MICGVADWIRYPMNILTGCEFFRPAKRGPGREIERPALFRKEVTRATDRDTQSDDKARTLPCAFRSPDPDHRTPFSWREPLHRTAPILG